MNYELYIPRDVEDAKKVEDLLLKHSGAQMRDIWKLGLTLGLRINELLQIKHSDLKGNSLHIVFSKTRSHGTPHIQLPPAAIEIISDIKEQHPMDEFVFQSRNSRNIKNKEPKPISRQAVYKAFKEVGDILNEKLSPHSMRHAAVMNILQNLGCVPNHIHSSRLTTEVIKTYYTRRKDKE